MQYNATRCPSVATRCAALRCAALPQALRLCVATWRTVVQRGGRLCNMAYCVATCCAALQQIRVRAARPRPGLRLGGPRRGARAVGRRTARKVGRCAALQRRRVATKQQQTGCSVALRRRRASPSALAVFTIRSQLFACIMTGAQQAFPDCTTQRVHAQPDGRPRGQARRHGAARLTRCG